MNVIVKPDVQRRYHKVLRSCFLLIVQGTMQKQGGILNVSAEGARSRAASYLGLRRTFTPRHAPRTLRLSRFLCRR